MEGFQNFVAGIAPYWKAVVAFLTPGIIAFVGALQESSPGGSQVTGVEWGGILAAMFITGGAVYTVPNKDPEGKHQEESVQPPVDPDLVQGDVAMPEVPADKADGNGL
jgi:hypothetical protein